MDTGSTLLAIFADNPSLPEGFKFLLLVSVSFRANNPMAGEMRHLQINVKSS